MSELAGKPCPRCGRLVESVEERVERGRAVLYAKHTVAGKPILCPLGRKDKALTQARALEATPSPPELQEAPPKPPEPRPALAVQAPGVPRAPEPPIVVEEYVIVRYITLEARVKRECIVVPWSELNRVFISLAPHLAVNFVDLFRSAKRVEYSYEGLVFRMELR